MPSSTGQPKALLSRLPASSYRQEPDPAASTKSSQQFDFIAK